MAKGIIVDDSKFMRRIIRETLIEGGHEVIGEADNGIDGIEMFKALKPDFATMDITMAGLDGVATISEIKKIHPDAHILVISALNEQTLKLSYKTIDVNVFITKPFEKSQLLGALSKLL
jgi:two-component system, chemotaxis family, chemotaxis protein CheY